MDPSQVKALSNDKIGIKNSFFYGFQSLLACNLFLGPIVLIGIFQMDVAAAAAFIGTTFLACGIATLLQAGLFLKMQVIQGVSFATFGAIVAVVMGADWPTLVGALLVSSAFIFILGATRVFSKLVRIFIPGLIAGTVIIIVGLALIPVTFTSIVGLPGNPGVNFFIAGITFVAVVLFMRLGQFKSKFSQLINIGSVIYAMILGTIVAAFFGQVDLSPVMDAPWFAIPKLFPFGPPKFEMNSILIFLVIMIISMLESVGTWFTITELSGEEVDDKRLDKGVMGEGIGVFIGSLFGCLPISSYASNTGVLVITKVFSRYAALAAGVIAILMSFFPKLMYLIAIVPSSVIWGIYALICISILMSGFSSIQRYPKSERNNLVVGISILATIGAGLIPMDIVMGMPGLVSYMFQAPIAVGVTVAIVANLVIRAKDEDKIQPSEISPVAAPVVEEVEA